MQLVILAGGKGTRLGLKDIPKPMVLINGIPLLEHQILLAKKYGINEIFILSGYKAEVISKYFSNGEKYGIKIHHTVEDYPLGTAGALKSIEDKLEERFLVFYGDIFMDFDINCFINFDKKYNSTGTILVHPNDHPYDSDLIEVQDNKVKKIHTKPHNSLNYYSNLVNAAVYIFSSKIMQYIKADRASDIAKDILPELLRNNEIIIAYNSAEYIKDIGTPSRLEEVTNDIKSLKTEKMNKSKKRPCIFLDRDGVINKDMGNHPVCSKFILLPNTAKAVRLINESGYLAIVVTNQPMIAKGFVSKEEVENTNKKMETLLGEERAYLNAIYYCPHHPDKGYKGEIPELKTECDCRKPKTGMLQKAANEFNIDIENSWIIGDSRRDILAGKNFGCKTISIGQQPDADFSANNLLEAVEYILRSNN